MSRVETFLGCEERMVDLLGSVLTAGSAASTEKAVGSLNGITELGREPLEGVTLTVKAAAQERAFEVCEVANRVSFARVVGS